MAVTLTGLAGAADEWSVKPDEAMQQAQEQKKGVLMEFTGSDWCGACIMQKKQAFSRPDVMKAITKAFIPVELDFPRRKPQDEQTKKRFEELKIAYDINAYPTLIFTDSQGKPVHIVIGYNNPEQVMGDAARAEQALKTQQEMLAKLSGQLSNDERKNAVIKLLKTVPESSIRTFYKPFFEELPTLDPSDTCGIRTTLERKDLLQRQTNEMVAHFREHNLFANRDSKPDESLVLLNDYLKKPDLLPEVRQKVLMNKVNLLINQNRVTELEQFLKEGIAQSPDSREGQLFQALLKKLPEIQKARANLKPGEQPPLPPGAIPATKMIMPPAAAPKTAQP